MSPHAVIAEFEYDLGDKSPTEALEKLRADAANGDAEPPARLVGALKKLVGASWSPVSEDEYAKRATDFKKEEELLKREGWMNVEVLHQTRGSSTFVARVKVRVESRPGGVSYSRGGFTRARAAAEFADALKIALGKQPKNFGEEYVLAEEVTLEEGADLPPPKQAGNGLLAHLPRRPSSKPT